MLFPNPTDGAGLYSLSLMIENRYLDCANDARTSFFVLFGYSLLSPAAPRNVVKGVDQNACFRECSHPKVKSDGIFPFSVSLMKVKVTTRTEFIEINDHDTNVLLSFAL